MKTFLWTTLFWIVAAIAGLLCLGFGNLGTQVLDNAWIAKFLPNNIQTASCDSIVASTLENMDWCAMAETNNCILAETENDTMGASGYAQYQEAFENILANQQIIYSYLQESFDDTNRAISNLGNSNLKEVEEQKIDEKEQQRLELQAQIEALQNEMNNL